ncbi:Axial regulator YABBY 4 [Glycine max]|nr:Axial regulator YABBY 4 [Glycine max]
MSTLNHLFDLPEQICYIQCGFCSTILMVIFQFNCEKQVSVPCSSLSMVVTVRCGHCTSLFSVNMSKASFIPFHLLASLSHLEVMGYYLAISIFISFGILSQNAFVTVSTLQPKESSPEEDANKTLNSHSASMMTYSDCEEEDVIPMSHHVVNKPPEKRQRTPSAYNCFIKKEIKRLKAENPDMAHKEAFSTAAKNWANFPQTQWCRGDEESCSQTDQLVNSQVDPPDAELVNFLALSFICVNFSRVMSMKKVKDSVEERSQEIPSWKGHSLNEESSAYVT